MKVSLGKKHIKRRIIRFKRRGGLKKPNFDIVVVHKNRKESTGYYLEKIGHYDPNATERIFFINSQRLAFWVSQGVEVHKTVKKYLVKFLV